MSKKTISLLVFLLLINFLEGHELFNQGTIFSTNYFYMFCLVMMVTLIRHICKAYGVLIPFGVFLFVIGICWNVGIQYSKWMDRVTPFNYNTVRFCKNFYLPLITFNTAFNVDVHCFYKSLTQILIISFPVCLVSAISCGLLTRYIIDPSTMTVVQGLYLGLANSAIYPVDVIRLLRENTIQNRHITTLLQGETIISASIAVYTTEVIKYFVRGWVIYWYQFLVGVVRMVLGGLFVGYIVGSLSVFLMKFSYNDPTTLMLLTFTTSYITYFIGEFYFGLAGIFATAIAGIMMAYERQSLSKEVSESVASFWKMVSCLSTGCLLYMAGALTTTAYLGVHANHNFKDYILVFVTYVLWNIFRLLSFFLFAPILSRVGYGLTFPNMILCVWAGMKNPICANRIIDDYLLEGNIRLSDNTSVYYLHTLSVLFLMLVINGSFTKTLLETLGLTNISIPKQLNMNSCMRHLYEARSRTAAILKMDRFLSDANWPLVMNSTALKNPYKKSNNYEDEEDKEDGESYLLGYKYTFCPGCEKEIPNDPTPKEIREMTKEAKHRLLKLRKTIYSRQYENGLLSKEGLRILHQAVEIAMDSNQLVIELDGLFRMFTKEKTFYRFVRNKLQALLKSKNVNYKAPRSHWKSLCLNFINSKFFDIAVPVIFAINAISLIVYFVMTPKTLSTFYFNQFAFNILFFVAYFAIFVLKVYTYTWSDKIIDGLGVYFGFVHNIIEYTILCFTFVVTFIGFVRILISEIPMFIYPEILLFIFLILRIIELLKFLKYIKFFRIIPSATMRYLNIKVDSDKALAFDMAKNYFTAEEELLENLSLIIDNVKIRNQLKEKIESDRLAIARKIGFFAKQGSWLVSTVKTKAATRSVLNGMKEELDELKISGWIDDIEYRMLLKALNERYKFVNNIKDVTPTAPRKIFQEVPYIGNDPKLINFLYNNIGIKKFDPGDIVVDDGDVLEGIYIVVTGMFTVLYTPNESITTKLRTIGLLPGVDNVNSLAYEESLMEYIVPGNTIGELSTITERPYSGVITAQTHSQVFFLKREFVKEGMEIDNDPVTGLECRIWKYISFRLAVSVMTNVPYYRSYTQEKIKYILERCFVPNLSNYKIFVVNEMMSDIILIEGIVVDYNTRDLYIAPCYIPRAVQKLVLPKSSLVNIDVPVETKLLIIPAANCDEYEIMLNEEEVCEMVNDNASICLQHLVKNKFGISTKASYAKMSFKGSGSKGLKKRLQSLASTKSKISFISSSPQPESETSSTSTK